VQVEKITAAAKTKTVVRENKPEHYWEDPDLHLCADGKHADAKGAKHVGHEPTAPRDYIYQLQQDLHELGYLDKAIWEYHDGVFDKITARAVLRFRRHAARTYRVGPGGPDDVALANTFQSKATPVCDAPLAKEIRKWIDRGLEAPDRPLRTEEHHDA
jgi:hypothetical protein